MRKDRLRFGGVVLGGFAATVLFALCPAHAQTNPQGQVVPPGATPTRANSNTPTNCTGQEPNSAAGTTTEPNCVAAGPGFITPSTNTPLGDKGRRVISLVRVDAAVPRPPVALPEGDSFSTVGNITMVRVLRPELNACLATGRRISARAGARTSTTCVDHKGDVLAYEECKANSTESDGCTVINAEEIQKQQTVAVKTQ